MTSTVRIDASGLTAISKQLRSTADLIHRFPEALRASVRATIVGTGTPERAAGKSYGVLLGAVAVFTGVVIIAREARRRSVAKSRRPRIVRPRVDSLSLTNLTGTVADISGPARDYEVPS